MSCPFNEHHHCEVCPLFETNIEGEGGCYSSCVFWEIKDALKEIASAIKTLAQQISVR